MGTYHILYKEIQDLQELHVPWPNSTFLALAALATGAIPQCTVDLLASKIYRDKVLRE